MKKVLKHNRWLCLKCNYVVESVYRHHYNTCKCGSLSVDGGHDYIKLTGDFQFTQNMCEYVEVWEDGDKIKCVDNKGISSLEFGKVYTVDTLMNTADNRVWLKEIRRFSFLKSRFELVEEQ